MSQRQQDAGYLVVGKAAGGFGMCLFLLLLGCSPDAASDLETAYEQRVQQINRTYHDALATLTSPSSEEEARQPARLAATAAEQTRAIDPPPVYKQGHELLIQFYERSEDFLSLGVEIDLKRRTGGDTTQLDERHLRLATELLELWQEVTDALPFLERPPGQ